MTVKELKDILDNYSDNTEIAIQSNTGDYWGTTLADDIEGIDFETVGKSEYYNGRNQILDCDQIGHDDYANQKEILVIS